MTPLQSTWLFSLQGVKNNLVFLGHSQQNALFLLLGEYSTMTLYRSALRPRIVLQEVVITNR